MGNEEKRKREEEEEEEMIIIIMVMMMNYTQPFSVSLLGNPAWKGEAQTNNSRLCPF